jgi:hypothetical protein
MARDFSPKERQKKQLERKLGQRASYDRILIVCEGTKTEPLYFGEIRGHYRLHTANVEVRACSFGTAPIQVVRYAKELFEKGDCHRKIQRRAFEQIFAVFDRDDHPSYALALQLAESLNGRLRNEARQSVAFHAIASVPCFELWLLLHFEEIHAPIHRDEVLRRLGRYMPDYEKGMEGVFEATRCHRGVAAQRATRLSQRATAYTHPEPYTDVASLVELLVTLRP